MDGELHYETHRVHSIIIIKRNFNATLTCLRANVNTEIRHKNTKVHKIQDKIIGTTMIVLWPFSVFCCWVKILISAC